MKFEILSAIIGIIGSLSSFLTFLYFKNERFYILIQRIMLKLSSKQFPIILKGNFSFSTNLNKETIKKILFEKFNCTNGLIETQKDDNYFKFKVNVLDSPYNETKIYISFENLTFVSLIQENIRTIRKVLNNIKETINANLTNSDFILEFKEKNPYEGFFVKRLPFENIIDFSVKIKIENTIINAKRDKIIIYSKDLDSSFNCLEDITTIKLPLFEKSF